MLKNKTNITTEKDITVLNNDTEYNEIHRECFGQQKPELLTSVFSVSEKEPLWYCETLPQIFGDDVYAYGWQR